MSQDVALQAEQREDTGKKVAAQLRADGKVPAVIQEHGKESTSVVIDGLAILKAYQQAGRSQAIDLTLGSTKKLVLIKEISFVPLKNEVQHVVFQALKADEAVDAEVAIHIVGDIPAEQNRLAVLHTMETLQIRALPKDLPESLEVSGEGLAEIDDRIDVGDIKLPEGVELVEMLTNADDEEKQKEFLAQPVAIVKEPQAAPEPEEEEQVAEGEVPSEHGSEEGPADGSSSTDSADGEKPAE